MPHPYKNLPAKNFWRKAVTDVPRQDLMLPVASSFQVQSTDKVATAGSCFAQHLANGLKSSGFNYFVPEGGEDLDPKTRKERNYGVYSARYGNIYTTTQLLQLLQEAYSLRTPIDRVWKHSDGRFYDPYRPAIEPDGFESPDALLASRDIMLAAVRRIVEESNIFVFTLGLTETWRNREDGSIYPVVPGAVIGEHDPAKHEFLNLSVSDVRESLEEAISLFRDRNPSIRFLLTVSPVPLVATYEDRHVLSSTTYSKSVLRVVAEEVSRAQLFVTYFPSYEIITGHYNGGLYFEPDMRNVSMRGVRHVMRNFMREMTEQEDKPDTINPDIIRQSNESFEKLSGLVCEEEALDADANG
jgi:hypothetical protein